MNDPARRRVVTLVSLLGFAGWAHFVRPAQFEPLIPRQLPGSARSWVLVSGGAEIACAAAVACPRTRRMGATASAALFVAVFPGNVKMALNYRRAGRPWWQQGLTWARLPLQWPLVSSALRVRKAASS